MKCKKERSPNRYLWHKLDGRAVTTDDITSNLNQMNKSTWNAYESLPHPTKYRARIRTIPNAPKPLIDKPNTKKQQYPQSSYPFNNSSTLPRPPKAKLNVEKVSCFEMKEPFLSLY